MNDEPIEREGQASTRGLADYWAIAVERRWTILLPLFLCWAVVWTVMWFIPSTYTSEALILVEQQKIPEQYVVPNVTESLQDRLQSMTEQILSRTRLQETIDRHNLYGSSGSVNKLLPSTDPVLKMRKDIKIEPVNSAEHPMQLTAFKIEYSARTPKLAQQINTELASLFVQEDLRSQQELSEGTTAFLQSQLNDAKLKLEEQEEKVRAFKAKHFGDLPSQTVTNVSILSGLQNQLQNTQRDLDSARQQKLYLESLQQQYQTAQTALGPESSPNSDIAAVTKELNDLQQQLLDAKVHLTDEHPDVIALKDKIAKTEKRKKDLEADLAAHPDNGPSGKTIDPGTSASVKHGTTSSMMQVQSQLKALQLEIANYEQHVNELERQIADYRNRLNMTPQTEQELADVSRGYEESKANYASLLQKQNQSQLATSLQERQQGQQFRILDPPNLPRKPSSPNRVILSIGGLAGGAALGLGLAFLLEIKHNVLRNQDDLHGIIPARVLVGIPHLAEPGEDQFTTTWRWLEIAAVSVMGILILVGNAYTFHKS
jgi:polysaccharide biosynthesis transport protein